jgi:hypothetical protein
MNYAADRRFTEYEKVVFCWVWHEIFCRDKRTSLTSTQSLGIAFDRRQLIV